MGITLYLGDTKKTLGVVYMQWTREATKAIKKVPFFVRKRVKARVEEEAARSGAGIVTIEHVRSCQRRFLNKMENEVKGFQIETCFGPTGCPNRAVTSDGLADELERLLAQKKLMAFLKRVVDGPLKMHHEFRVSISDCPNACSRPQIVDIGLIGAVKPRVTDLQCTDCGQCVEACKESAIMLGEHGPEIAFEKCLLCGSCIRACPTGTISGEKSGYRILLGGKLGRHPRLGQDVGRIFPIRTISAVVELVVDFYKRNCIRGERLGTILEGQGIKDLIAEMKNRNLLT